MVENRNVEKKDWLACVSKTKKWIIVGDDSFNVFEYNIKTLYVIQIDRLYTEEFHNGKGIDGWKKHLGLKKWFASTEESFDEMIAMIKREIGE